MFLLSNIAAEGMLLWSEDPAPGKPHAMRLWLDGEEAVVGLTAGGNLIAQCPGALPEGLRKALAGCEISTIVAPNGQVPRLIEALGLTDFPLRHHDEEPGYRLALADLILPDLRHFRSRPLADDDRTLLHGWRAAYLTEVFAVPPDEAAAKARTDVQGWIATGSHRLLLRDGVPVALSGFNAMLPQVVQVGGVYTPPGSRGQGLARRAVAAHLAEARASGVNRATLFAANEAAARAYVAIGFRRSGTMGIAQFDSPLRIAGTA